MIVTIAAQQVRVLRRQRIFLTLLGTLMVMTALAGVIGWSSHHTIVGVYDQAVQLLTAAGQPTPPSPFALKPTLSLLSNMAIYIPLIGALLAIVLGHLSLADDQSTGVGQLIFTRAVSRTDYILGKMLGAAGVLAAILTISVVLSAVSLLVVNQAVPSAADIGRLIVFYGLSWLYLLLFALVGMLTVLMTRRRSLALLSALGVWLVLTFVVPQFTSGLRPTASLNPISNPVSLSQPFFDLTARARPLSVSEQYKTASAQILQTAAPDPATVAAGHVLPIAVITLVLGLLIVALVRRHDYSRATANE